MYTEIEWARRGEQHDRAAAAARTMTTEALIAAHRALWARDCDYQDQGGHGLIDDPQYVQIKREMQRRGVPLWNDPL